jgi:uncharacterized protein YcaQ
MSANLKSPNKFAAATNKIVQGSAKLMKTVTLDDLRRFAVARTLFSPTTLKRALHKFGFVQADPIRAPARAQDLILRHRVKDYSAGDLERRYQELGVQEDFFINYGFVTSDLQSLMHPRANSLVPAQGGQPWPAASRKKAGLLLEFIQKRGAVHPRELDNHFSHGIVRNYWGGSSNATTRLLDAMHYRGLLRVARREGGIRIYSAHQHGLGPADPAERRARVDALADAAVNIYGPLSAAGLSFLIRRLRFAVPQWGDEVKTALHRAKHRLAHAHVDGIDWYWPARENAIGPAPRDVVRLLTPFDPLVWDRSRFELFWSWVYRFEAYTPAPKRKLGYYAMPLLWRDRVIGWGNLSVKSGKLDVAFGYIESRPPRDRAYERELEAELDRMRSFLRLDSD